MKIQLLQTIPVANNENLTPGSIHETVDPPEIYERLRGVWILNAVGVEVRLSFREYIYIKEES